MKIELSNRVALVTDASTEIGQAICIQLAESGATVIGLLKTDEEIKSLNTIFQTSGQNITLLPADILDFENCTLLVKQIESEFENIDIVVNNSDVKMKAKFTELDQQQWQNVVHSNLDPAFNLCRQISEGMSERGFGRIINISSIYARMGLAEQSAYAASKAGLHGFTMALAQELARKGVTVNTVSPGQIRDKEIENMPAEDANNLLMNIPASRFGEVEDVASLVDFLCSQNAGYITGNDIAVNGGQYIH